MANLKEKKRKLRQKIPGSLQKAMKLIGNMTSGQKRGFMRDARYARTKAEEMLYIKFFEEINRFLMRGKSVDDPAIITVLSKRIVEEMKGAIEIDSPKVRQVISQKSTYLYSRILVSMRFMSTGSNTLKELNGRMQDIYYLYDSEMTRECIELLNDTLAFAVSLNRPAYIHELSLLHLRILGKSSGQGITAQEIKRRDQLHHQAEDDIHLLYYLASLNNRLISESTAKGAVSPEYQVEVINIYDKYPNTELQNQLSPRVRLEFYRLMMSSTDLSRKYKNTGFDRLEKAKFEEKMFNLLKSEPIFRDNDLGTYQTGISRHLLQMLNDGRSDDVEKELKEFVHTGDELFQTRVLAYVWIQAFNNQNKFHRAVRYIEEDNLFQKIEKHSENIWPSRYVVLLFIGAYPYFMVQKYEQCLEWAQCLVNDTQKILPSMKLPGYFMTAVCKFEMDTTDIEVYLDELKNNIDDFRNFFPGNRGASEITFSEDMYACFRRFFRLYQTAKHDIPKNRMNVLETAKALRTVTYDLPGFDGCRIPLAWLIARLANTKIQDEVEDPESLEK